MKPVASAALLVIALQFFLIPTAFGQEWEETRITSDEGIGQTVAVYGDVAVFGAHDDEEDAAYTNFLTPAARAASRTRTVPMTLVER